MDILTKKYDDNRSEKVRKFLAEIDAVCRKRGLSLGHEDRHGAFQVYGLSEETQEWLGCACDMTGGT